MIKIRQKAQGERRSNNALNLEPKMHFAAASPYN